LDIVGIEYTEPAKGTKVVGRDVACDPERFYRSLANPRTVKQMRQAVNAAFESAAAGKPVYLHCSGGKDRAGILTLLILTVLGASRDDILKDYLETNVARNKNYERFFNRFLKFADGNQELARELTEAHSALPENLTAFYEAVDEAYGSMADFVRNQLGIDDERREQLTLACTTPRVS
jgi:protein tyrosine/serine phosphatase